MCARGGSPFSRFFLPRCRNYRRLLLLLRCAAAAAALSLVRQWWPVASRRWVARTPQDSNPLGSGSSWAGGREGKKGMSTGGEKRDEAISLHAKRENAADGSIIVGIICVQMS